MALVWDGQRFRGTLSRKYPGQTDSAVARLLQIEGLELDLLVALSPPADAALAPHPEEIRILERRLEVNAEDEGWISDDRGLTNRAIEESYPVLVAEPIAPLRYLPRDAESARDFFALFTRLTQRVWICGLGQRIEFTGNGLRFLALDSSGVHAYVHEGRNLGLAIRQLDRWATVTIPRRRRWLHDRG
jgi:hypothetical protein